MQAVLTLPGSRPKTEKMGRDKYIPFLPRLQSKVQTYIPGDALD